MLKLSYLSAVGFSGAEAGEFLHNQLSADVKGLAAGESTFACYCEPKGRVLALLLVQRLDAGYQVVLSAELAESVTARLKMYRLRARVDIEIMNDRAVFGLQLDEPAPAPSMPVPGSGSRLLLAEPGGPADDDDALREAWKFADLESGICWLGEKTSGEFLPQMLGFEELGAVNYRKGCYPGQEIVARTHYLGKVKRHPRLLDCRLSGAPRPMDKLNLIADGQTHEAVVADCASGPDGTLRLLTVTRMEPETVAGQIEYNGETVAVIPPG